jgi:hypothetical protein
MRRWDNRSSIPSQMDITRLRAIGEWGHASRFVGSRWEEVGLDRLREGVAGRSPLALLPVYTDPVLQSALAATGSKNPDVVLLFAPAPAAEAGSVLVQPADLKWSLDVASYRQISAGVLEHLLAQVPRLSEDLRALLPPNWGEPTWLPRDGFFFCPRSVANERFVKSPENQRQEYPIEPQEVLFAAVEPIGFFEPLPGWATARELARMDGLSRGLGQLDTADRYYHLGAGVAGALVAQDGSIFDEEAEIEPAQEGERLRAFLPTLRAPSTTLLLERLTALMRHRQDLARELRDLSRGAYTFRDFAQELVAAGAATEDEPEAQLRRQWGEGFRALLEAHDGEVRQAGRRLRAGGASDAEALRTLGAQRDAFARRLRTRARALIREKQANASGASEPAEPR